MTRNLADQVSEQLPSQHLRVLRTSGQMAAKRGHGIYLVGGVVRDLLLARPSLDIDLVVETDAREFASVLANGLGGSVLRHDRFLTSKFCLDDLDIDIVTARREIYPHPGALPIVEPNTIQEDLRRRDFTINALAIDLRPQTFGLLVDPFNGEEDLMRGLIRILHDESFIDDATRILRAIRYEQRFDFRLETETERLLLQHVPGLRTVGADRLRHELDLILKENEPEKAIVRLGSVNALQAIHPSLVGDGWVAERFREARRVTNTPSPALYYALLFYRLNQEEATHLASYLRLPRSLTRIIVDQARLRQAAPVLEEDLSNSAIYGLLKGCSPTAVLASIIVTESDQVRHKLQLYLSRLRYVKPLLDGNSLQELGVISGPQIGEMLNALLEARLDSRAHTREDEIALVHAWQATEKGVN